ncbi:type I-E CRISPR-associated protein Cse2/CasB [Nocardiopsis sp. L17-MgMaSL7]|uniref:type I-E CRISPR-associated protein Cse2/CasB n=1 Tax=Nocardiopsis sp. L17-MgMaSL7 TaxID=1938893 RepID=UPI000D715E38|nr:type I-E CRISPR-associated protein Cse2/CasB [Nocardiopsis sp. L17-MgMaSL7]PWV54733.1 CRISPR system Cascade subunit CasB [Nocardiopsis sp. L17-MgMaSL7]
MTSTSRTDHVHELRPVGEAADERIRQLQAGYLQDRSDAVATLAKLRRGAGKTVEAVPELVGLTIDHDFYDRFGLEHPRICDAEAAVHEALTLYALHQQSKREKGMHRRGRDFGGAVRRLMPSGDIDEPLRKRFVQAQTANSAETRIDRLRGIVTLLRTNDIQLDYGLLADQLYDARTRSGAERVRRSWGRGFQAYRLSKAEREAEQDAPGTQPAG